jgi:L-methionine (R)-S-oxide reductase
MNVKKYKVLQNAISELLKQSKVDWGNILSEIISFYDCSTGTIHLLEKDTSLLKIKAHQGIPEFLLPKLSTIPIGKGMAGIAAERREAVEGSVAIPMLIKSKLYGVFGIAKPVSYDFTKEEIDSLLKLGEEISRLSKHGQY